MSCLSKRSGIASVFVDKNGNPDANVQGFLDSICDVFSCLRLRSGLKRSLPATMAKGDRDKAEALIDDFDAQACGPAGIVFLVIRLLGLISGGIRINNDELEQCLKNFEEIARLIMRIFEMLDGGSGGGGLCDCLPSGGGGGQPSGFNPAPDDADRGC